MPTRSSTTWRRWPRRIRGRGCDRTSRRTSARPSHGDKRKRGIARSPCATPREVDRHRGGRARRGHPRSPTRSSTRGAWPRSPRSTSVTVAVDSEATIEAAASAGISGMPRRRRRRAAALRLRPRRRRPARRARPVAAGSIVRGVMGYEGHLMMVDGPPASSGPRSSVAMEILLTRPRRRRRRSRSSAGGTGTYDLHDATGITELQAGSYALMDTALRQARSAVPTGAVRRRHRSSRVRPTHAVADVGLKALGMDHGNPAHRSAPTCRYCSDEHVTFNPHDGVTRRRPRPGRAGARRPDDGDARARHGSCAATTCSNRGRSTCGGGTRDERARRRGVRVRRRAGRAPVDPGRRLVAPANRRDGPGVGPLPARPRGPGRRRRVRDEALAARWRYRCGGRRRAGAVTAVAHPPAPARSRAGSGTDPGVPRQPALQERAPDRDGRHARRR